MCDLEFWLMNDNKKGGISLLLEIALGLFH